MKIALISGAVAALMMAGCAVSDSMLEYSKEGTARVASGYEAKAKMTKYLTEYLAKANEGCGVVVKVIDGVPVTTVKECIRPADVMASVDKMPIVQPQKIETITDGVGDMLIKATNIVVPVASIYYGYKNNLANQEASVAINSSNNEAQTSMWSGYTSNFQNTNTVTDTATTSTNVTDTTTVTDTQITNTQEIPNVQVDINSTTIN